MSYTLIDSPTVAELGLCNSLCWTSSANFLLDWDELDMINGMETNTGKNITQVHCV